MKSLFFVLALSAGMASPALSAPPRLVLVVVLDQFRYDYLTRFREHFGPDGFAYLLRDGANFSNATFKHSMNTTGPGHTTIATGSYADQNGIIANNWVDRHSGEDVYCMRDRTASIVGSGGEGVSPMNIFGSGLGDVLRLHTSFRSRVVSVSNKDRAAIALGGKFPNATYWMKDSVFVTSTFYARQLPDWVRRFNASPVIRSYFNTWWDRILPIQAYDKMDVDDAPYESGGNGLGNTFPHRVAGEDTTRITPSYYWAMLDSPFGSEVLAAFAKEVLVHEGLGKGNATDALFVSFSCNDHVGHSFGPDSHEVLDMTVRTDRVLADFFGFVDRHVGLKNCLIALTSDHGVTPIPEFVKKHNPAADAGRIPAGFIRSFADDVLTRAFGEPEGGKWIRRITGYNIYLNMPVLRKKNLDPESVALALADSLMKVPQIALAVARPSLRSGEAGSPMVQKMRRSFHPSRSGDVVYALRPYYLEGNRAAGTSHGLPYDHDAHVPMIILGDGVRPGVYAGESSPSDLAPTLAAILGIGFPAGRGGRVLHEALE